MKLSETEDFDYRFRSFNKYENMDTSVPSYVFFFVNLRIHPFHPNLQLVE